MASRLKHRKATQNRLKAMAHPMRVAIFRVLTERVASLGEITRELDLPREEMGNVRFHLHQLVKLGCAEEVGKRLVNDRNVKVYKAIDRALVETDEWEDFVKVSQELADHVLGELMQVLLDRLTESAKAGILSGDSDLHLTHTPMILDQPGVEEMLALAERTRLEAAEIERHAAKRRSSTGGAIHASNCILFFKTPA
jgi:DNA-binding transcriptional ArsR family regulator